MDSLKQFIEFYDTEDFYGMQESVTGSLIDHNLVPTDDEVHIIFRRLWEAGFVVCAKENMSELKQLMQLSERLVDTRIAFHNAINDKDIREVDIARFRLQTCEIMTQIDKIVLKSMGKRFVEKEVKDEK